MDLQPKWWKSIRLTRAFAQGDVETVRRLKPDFSTDELRAMAGEKSFELQAILANDWAMLDVVYPDPDGHMEGALSRWVGWYSSTLSRPYREGQRVMLAVLDRWTERLGMETLRQTTVSTSYKGTLAMEEAPPGSWSPRPFGERMEMDHPGFCAGWEQRHLARHLPDSSSRVSRSGKRL
jgi:hypothetical protein